MKSHGMRALYRLFTTTWKTLKVANNGASRSVAHKVARIVKQAQDKKMLLRKVSVRDTRSPRPSSVRGVRIGQCGLDPNHVPLTLCGTSFFSESEERWAKNRHRFVRSQTFQTFRMAVEYGLLGRWPHFMRLVTPFTLLPFLVFPYYCCHEVHVWEFKS